MSIVAEKPVAEILPLAQGDRLTRNEFERRYEAMPHIKKAELIEGTVYMPSPVRSKQHGKPHFKIISWLGAYTTATPGVEGDDNSSLRLDMDNEPQPDAALTIAPECGGQARIDSDGYLTGAPELIVEIAASSANYDLHDKLNAYRRNGVKEYLVWRVLENEVDWFVLRDGDYMRLEPDESGLLKSEVFPGLWLDVSAVLDGDAARLSQKLQEVRGTEEHAVFVRKLAEK